MSLDKIFHERPFKVRNADEYDITNILNLFVSPTEGLVTPYDYENTIIKGRMGSGKTMYLRANHGYYLSTLIPSLMEDDQELILPVFIRLNDFQHIPKPEDVYRAVIIKIVEELTSIYLHLDSADKLAKLHSGMRFISDGSLHDHKLSTSLKQLARLGSEEYIERVVTELGLAGAVKAKFFELSSAWKKTDFVELKNKPNPGIKDVEECYRNLLEGREGKILLLLDEAGSLDKSFFRNSESGPCLFEIMMNQLRTASYIRTKIAVYPNSYSDMLTETRYGDVVMLEETVTEETSHERYRERAYGIINNYLNDAAHVDEDIVAEDVFELATSGIYGDVLEQIMYASHGNMRRLIQLLDMAMHTAYSQENRAVKVNKDHASKTLKQHAIKTESTFNTQEKEFLSLITSLCKSRGAFKFRLPNVPLYKYTGKSQEYNLINVEQLGSGSRSTMYSIDYCYAVLKDLPTHTYEDSEKVYDERSMDLGKWISRVATIDKSLFADAPAPAKVEGEVEFIKGGSGMINSDTNESYFFKITDVIEADQNKPIVLKKRVRFYPASMDDTKRALLIEVL